MERERGEIRNVKLEIRRERQTDKQTDRRTEREKETHRQKKKGKKETETVPVERTSLLNDVWQHPACQGVRGDAMSLGAGM